MAKYPYPRDSGTWCIEYDVASDTGSQEVVIEVIFLEPLADVTEIGVLAGPANSPDLM